MARPFKSGLEFWSKDTDFYNMRIIRKLGRKCHAEGLVILDCVFCKLFTEGYFLKIDEDLADDIAEETFTSSQNVIDTISTSVEIGIFDAELFAKESILTSRWVQRMYFTATARRQKPTSYLPYLLSESINDNENQINVNNNGVSVVNNPPNKLIKVNTNTNNYSYSNTGLIDKNTEEEVIQIFFLKNIKDLQSEYHKFIQHYSISGWKTADGKAVTNVFGIARAWNPHENANKFCSKSIALLAEVDNELRMMGFDIWERKKLREIDRVNFKEDAMYIDCSDSFKQLIEDNVERLGHIIRKYSPTIKYKIINE